MISSFVENKMLRKTIMVCAIIIFCNFLSCGIDFWKNEKEESNIRGVITKKFKDYNNHGAATIEYNMNNQVSELDLCYWGSETDLWEFIIIGDSIIKPSGSLTLRIKKANGLFKEYEYQY